MVSSHLVVINTYNRIEELNKTIRSINSHLPLADICVVSKGNERRCDVMGKTKYFHKAKNIGREAHGYIFAFFRHPNYNMYSFIQDKPSEIGFSFLGKEIKKAEEIINNGVGDFVTSMPLVITPKKIFLPKKVGLIIDLNEIGRFMNKKKINFLVKYTIGACFSVSNSYMANNYLFFKKIFSLFRYRKSLPWELEAIWLSLANKPIILVKDKNNFIIKHIDKRSLSFSLYLQGIYLYLLGFIKRLFLFFD